MNDLALVLDNVSKQYRLGVVGTGTLSHDLNRWWHKVRGKDDPYTQVGVVNDRSEIGGDYVWALKDINLKVKQGEILGVIGRNGAGKSTLLKLLSGITSPTTGKIYQNGRLASLLEVGTGFHPELTGKENIYLNGTILGMNKREISSKIDEIIAFSGCAKYVDTPVKRYSSGMRVRLGFAVAAFLEPEILIVDEVLAVGDAEFQKKAIGKMKEVSEGGGRTVLFVSHNMASIRQLCTSAVVMDMGQIVYHGETADAIDYYLRAENLGVDETGEIEWEEDNQPGGNGFNLKKVRLLNNDNQVKPLFSNEEPISVEIFCNISEEIRNMRLNFQLVTDNDTIVFSSSSHSTEEAVKKVGEYKYKVEIPKNLLNGGQYFVKLQAGVPKIGQLMPSIKVLKLSVEKLSDSGTIVRSTLPGVIAPDINWNITKV